MLHSVQKYISFGERNLESQARRNHLLQLIRLNIKDYCLSDKAIFEMSTSSDISSIELINLNISDINLLEKTVSIKRGNQQNHVPISNESVNLLQEICLSVKERDAPLFVNNYGERLSLSDLWQRKVHFALEIN